MTGPTCEGTIALAELRVDEADEKRERERRLLDAVQFRIARNSAALLDRLHVAGHLDRSELFAAQWLQVVWARTGLEPKVTARLGAEFGGGAYGSRPYGIQAKADRELDALEAWDQCMECLDAQERSAVRSMVRDERFEPRTLRAALAAVRAAGLTGG